MQIRFEEESDFGAVEAINCAAFEREAEANLVRQLRPRPETLSLVAADAGIVVGHILFSAVTVDGQRFAVAPLGLGPMSVSPDRQNQGVGSALVRAGLDHCRHRAVPFVVVLGHPDYYPRFGFQPASVFGLGCEWLVPDEVFLALELAAGALSGVARMVRYAPEFSRL